MNWPFANLQPNTFSVIYCDFPWQFEGYSSAGVPQRAPEQHYDTMTVQAGARLPVASLGAADCVLFMWCMSSHTRQMFWLAHEWGFRFSSKAFCWAKLNPKAEQKHFSAIYQMAQDGEVTDASIAHDRNWFMGLGHGTRRNTEDCWLFTRGNPKRRLIENAGGEMVRNGGVRELIVAPVREHSRKPDEAYDRIEMLFSGPYLELFSRSDRPGWTSWGKEAGKFQT